MTLLPKKTIKSQFTIQNIGYTLGWICVIIPVVGLFLIIRYHWSGKRRKASQIKTLMIWTYFIWAVYWTISSQNDNLPSILSTIFICVPFIIIYLLRRHN